MEALFLLVPLSLLAVGVAVWLFFRMNASGQFDDPEGPAWSVLMDDDRPQAPPGPAPSDEFAARTTNPALLDGDQGAASVRGHYPSRTTDESENGHE